jgi:ribosome maturation protein Sdo1
MLRGQETGELYESFASKTETSSEPAEEDLDSLFDTSDIEKLTPEMLTKEDK